MKTQVPAGSSATTGAFYALSAAVVFSTAGIIVRNIDLPAWDMSFWRSLLLIVTIWPFLLLHGKRTLHDLRHAGPSLVLSALMLAGSAVSFMLALSLAPVANVLIVCGATPFATALLARFFLHEPIHRHTLLAMIAAAFGLALSVASSLQANAFAGMAVASTVMLCMSGNYVVVRHRRDVAMQPALALTGVFSALIALPFVSFQPVSGSQIGWLLLLGPGQFAFGLLLYVASLKRIPAGRAALLGLLELVFGPVWVWLFDGERPGDWTLVGGLVVICAAATNVWLDSRLASANNRA
jgi:drug/metabolite transporter (DMT)-like permease